MSRSQTVQNSPVVLPENVRERDLIVISWQEGNVDTGLSNTRSGRVDIIEDWSDDRVFMTREGYVLFTLYPFGKTQPENISVKVVERQAPSQPPLFAL